MTLNQWRIHTPICSPSRSQTVSGRYFHNIKSDLAVPPPKLQPAASGHINATLYADASNVLSVAFAPAVGGGVAYAAWELFEGDAYVARGGKQTCRQILQKHQ